MPPASMKMIGGSGLLDDAPPDPGDALPASTDASVVRLRGGFLSSLLVLQAVASAIHRALANHVRIHGCIAT
jgi:hypothetical protein